MLNQYKKVCSCACGHAALSIKAAAVHWKEWRDDLWNKTFLLFLPGNTPTTMLPNEPNQNSTKARFCTKRKNISSKMNIVSSLSLPSH